MRRIIRTAYLIPAGIALLGLTIAMVGKATAAPAADPAAVLSAGMAEAQDFGAQDFRGAQDFKSADSASAPKITAAPQPGQTVSLVMPGNGSGSVGGPTPWTPASGPTSAPQPGQTIMPLTAPSAPKITAAPQPGQTVSLVTPGNGSGSVGGSTPWTPASGSTSAPQPGQTGW